MSDIKTIDFKKAKTITLTVEQLNGNIDIITDNQLRQLFSHLEQLATTGEQMQWISVNNSIPKRDRNQLIDIYTFRGFAVYGFNYKRSEGFGFYSLMATHWRPAINDRPEVK